MSKQTITHTCGHTSVARLFGKSSKREWQAQQLAQSLCEECGVAARQQRYDAEADARRAQGLPDLEGTPKQIHWANDLRKGYLKQLKDALFQLSCRTEVPEQLRRQIATQEDNLTCLGAICDRIQDEVLTLPHFSTMTPRRYRDLASLPVAVLFLREQDQASWWIEHREPPQGALDVQEAMDKLQKEQEAEQREKEIAQELEQKKIQELWNERDRVAKFLHETLGDLATQLLVWNDRTPPIEKRVYVGHGYNRNCVEYYATGNAKHRPGELVLGNAAQIRIGERLEEFRQFLADLANRYKFFSVSFRDGKATGE